jgi:hypothetical protein
MDVNFNGSLWWHNILQLYRGKKSSAQIFAKGSACQIQCRPRAWDTDCELKYHFLENLSRQKVSYITWKPAPPRFPDVLQAFYSSVFNQPSELNIIPS